MMYVRNVVLFVLEGTAEHSCGQVRFQDICANRMSYEGLLTYYTDFKLYVIYEPGGS